jgi:hypothetical protein
MPFPNYYDSGNMCYGQNVMPVEFKNNLKGLDYYYDVIQQSPFNSDLGINITSYRDDIHGWFLHLQKMQGFDYSLISSRARR